VTEEEVDIEAASAEVTVAVSAVETAVATEVATEVATAVATEVDTVAAETTAGVMIAEAALDTADHHLAETADRLLVSGTTSDAEATAAAGTEETEEPPHIINEDDDGWMACNESHRGRRFNNTKEKVINDDQ
jgi:hypothetical protein